MVLNAIQSQSIISIYLTLRYFSLDLSRNLCLRCHENIAKGFFNFVPLFYHTWLSIYFSGIFAARICTRKAVRPSQHQDYILFTELSLNSAFRKLTNRLLLRDEMRNAIYHIVLFLWACSTLHLWPSFAFLFMKISSCWLKRTKIMSNLQTLYNSFFNN